MKEKFSLWKKRKKEPKPFEHQSSTALLDEEKPNIDKKLLDPELVKHVEGAMKYIYQTSLLVSDVDSKMYDLYIEKYLKNNEKYPGDVNGELMNEMELLDVLFGNFLIR